MDWGNDYFTFSDTNIEYIWRFLRIVHERGWLFKGHRATEWCPRCGTSISAHELARELRRPRRPVALRPLPARSTAPGEAIVIWTTTPWTLPANVAAAVNPTADLRAARQRRLGRGRAAIPTRRSSSRLPGAELVGWRYEGPFDALGPGGEVEHRVIPWDDVSMEDGTGIVHIAPGCGGRGLRALEGARPGRDHPGRRGRPLLSRVRLAARALHRRGRRSDHRRPRGPRPARRRRSITSTATRNAGGVIRR